MLDVKKSIASAALFFGGLAGLLSAQPGEANEVSIGRVHYDIFSVQVTGRRQSAQQRFPFALVFDFQMPDKWHFYAFGRNAPAGMDLKLIVNEADGLAFGDAVYPESHTYYDKVLDKRLDVHSGSFEVYLPFEIKDGGDIEDTRADAGVSIEGAYCSAEQCRIISDLIIETKIDVGTERVLVKAKLVEGKQKSDEVEQVKSITEQGRGTGNRWTDYSLFGALLLAAVAGLSLNIMPCVWPVLPIIVMRLASQAADSKGKAIMSGLAFCAGILLFFAALAGTNIVLQLFYGTVLQWGDQFRNPVFVGVMSVLLVGLAMFMFGVVDFALPSSVSSKAGGGGNGYAGTVGTGFLAAVLSTPCSFAILAAVFAWAQGQHWIPATAAIMTIGVGMAAPYAVLTSMPGLLERLPKPGRWMALFKQGLGFLLLIIAVWLAGALPVKMRMSVLYFAVAVSFSIWMWGAWVGYNTALVKKWIVRAAAVGLTVLAGFYLLGAKQDKIDWQDYDSQSIQQAQREGRAVLIDFTAEWCLSCKVVDKFVYQRDDIAGLIDKKNVLAVKADTTQRDRPATRALKEVYKEPGVPVTILHLPGENKTLRWRGKDFGDDLKESLKKLGAK